MNKIVAIKALRDHITKGDGVVFQAHDPDDMETNEYRATGIGLKEAKDIVEVVVANLGIVDDDHPTADMVIGLLDRMTSQERHHVLCTTLDALRIYHRRLAEAYGEAYYPLSNTHV